MNHDREKFPFLISTNEAAQILKLKPQTLRKWAMDNSGPLKPIKIGNRLRWRLSDIEGICK
ncbi:helix-turn-helix domain-containing protein [Acinetobacter faecalis]|uniref:helix-turn-helix domain-containing protein n=1 Tax=Acinetobacter faecalis TaxID=2665161 RepID=UPI002A90A47F|nr:helix-turn-helix domain-containing protein [Acinetobacter faecalis]MDY6536605.1 helix-turn-helix domain-containing protein [Acinetobacter faecalis]